MASTLNYDKMTGFATTKGPMFEVKMAALLFARGLNSNLDFQLATNVAGAGAFDDIVFRFRPPGATTWTTLFVQLKHRETACLTKVMLTASKGPFSLPVYCKSYQTIKASMSCPEPKTLFDSCLAESTLVLLTNAPPDEDVGPGRGLELVPIDRLLGSDAGSVHSFDPEGSSDVDSEVLASLAGFPDDDAKHFMKALRVFSGQPAESQLNDLIKRELGAMEAGAAGDRLDVDRLCESFVESVAGWWEGSNKILDRSSDILRKARDRVVLEACCAKAKDSLLLDVRFTETTASPLRNVLGSGFQTLCVASSEKSSRLSCTKIVQALGVSSSYLLLGAEALLKHRTAVLNECCRGRYETVILVENASSQGGDFADIVKELAQFVASTKRLLVLTAMASTMDIDFLNPFKDTFEFYHLKKTSRISILDSEFCLQGHEVSWQKFLDGADENQVFSANLVLAILDKGKDESVGRGLPAGISYYVPRTLEKRATLKASLFRGSPDNMTVVRASLTDVQAVLRTCDPSLSHQHFQDALTGNYRLSPPASDDQGDEAVSAGETFNIGNYECYFMFLHPDFLEANALRIRPRKCDSNPNPEPGWFLFIFTGTSESDIKNLCKFHGSKHLLCFEHEKILWMKSEGRLDIIREHIDEKQATSYDPAEMGDSSDRLVLVCGEPGIGKTTLMAHVAGQIKASLPHFWVVLLALSDHSELFADGKHNDALGFLAAAAGIATPLELASFQHAMNVTGNVAIFLDGCDEISPTYSSECCILLSNILQTRAKKILATSRNTLKIKLEDHLKSTLAMKLRTFNEDDQRLFLQKYWKNKSTLRPEELDTYITRLIDKSSNAISDREKEFLSIPLQLLMLAEVLEEQVAGSAEPAELPEKLDMLHLLEQFVEKKLGVYVRDKLRVKTTDATYNRQRKIHKNNFIKTHTNAALFLLVGKENLKQLQKTNISTKASKFFEEIASCEDNTGIIDSITDKRPRFIHRVFAEYFAAVWFAEHFAENSQFLETNLCEADFSGIRVFFDRLLAKGYPLHTSVLNEDLDGVQASLDCGFDVNGRDHGGRTPLHLTAVLGPSKDKKEHAKRCTIMDLLIDNTEDFNLEDDVLKVSPLRLADLTQSWTAIDKLLVHNEAEDATRQLVKTSADVNNQRLFESVFLNDMDKLMEFCISQGSTLYTYQDDASRARIVMKMLQNSCTRMLAASVVKLPDFEGFPLHRAASRGDVALVKRLLQDAGVWKPEGEDNAPQRQTHAQVEIDETHSRNKREAARETDLINLLDRAGGTALSHAAFHGHAGVVAVLIEQGANKPNIHEVIMRAAAMGHTEVVRIILSSLNEIEMVKFLKTSTTVALNALHMAAAAGHMDAVKLLVKTMSESYRCSRTDKHVGFTALHLAASAGHLGVVRTLLEAVSDTDRAEYVKAADKNGRTALHWAAVGDNLEIIRLLLASVNEADRIDCVKEVVHDGYTALHAASAAGHLDYVEALLEVLGEADRADYIKRAARDGRTALFAAAVAGHLDVVRALIDALSETERSKYITATEINGCSALNVAAAAGHTEMFRLLLITLSETDRADFIVHADNDGCNALHFAAVTGHLDVVVSLLEAANETDKAEYIRTANNDGCTALHVAVAAGHLNVVRALCEALSESDRTEYIKTVDNDGCNALHAASAAGHLDVVRALIEGLREEDRAEYIKAESIDGRTALHAATKEGHTDIVRALIEALEDSFIPEYINIPDATGCTALHVGAALGYPDVVGFLCGASSGTESLVNSCDKGGNSVVHWAAWGGCLESVDIVVKAGGRLSGRNLSGHNPLMMAALEGHVLVVACLFDSWDEDKEGMSKLDLLNMCDNEGLNVFDLMQQAGPECLASLVYCLRYVFDQL